MTCCFFFFFFSSRRRHTRYWRDWSSDVCSSDLAMELLQDWGWNRFAPGMGALPEQFPDARCIHIAIDRTTGTLTLPWGLKLKAAPFFGIIGVAPPAAMSPATSIIPRAFGGNIDNKHFG